MLNPHRLTLAARLDRKRAQSRQDLVETFELSRVDRSARIDDVGTLRSPNCRATALPGGTATLLPGPEADVNPKMAVR